MEQIETEKGHVDQRNEKKLTKHKKLATQTTKHDWSKEVRVLR